MGSSRRVAPNGRWTLGLFTHGAGDPNSHNVWAGAASMAAERGANLICFPGKPLRSPLAFEAQSNILYDLVSERAVDGLVIWASGLPLFVEPQAVAAFCERYRPLPMVTVGIPVEGLPGARVDNFGGMHAVVDHLITAHRRRRIAFVRGPEGHQEAEDRYRAYVNVLQSHGVPLRPELVYMGNFKESGGLQAVENLVDQGGVAFDALVAASDNMAIGAMKALQSRGLVVPADVAVAGLNDEQQSAVVSPPLTTCPLHFYEQARKATEMVLALLEGEKIERDVVLPTRLLTRQSCGCPSPLVVEAARLKWDGELNLPTLSRDRLLDEVLRLADQPQDTSRAAAIRKLLDAIFAEIEAGAKDVALPALVDLVRSANAAGEPAANMHNLLSVVRTLVLACPLAPQVQDRAEDLFQQARVLLGEMAQRTQAYQVLRAEEQSRHLAHISERLSTTVELDELIEILAETLPELGIPSCYLALYENPAQPSGLARSVMAYDPEGRHILPPGGRTFQAQELVPRNMLPADHPYSLVVQPLYFRQDQIGFAVVEALPRYEEVYELLRGEISGALKRLQLLARNVELYNEAVQARLIAEEGRRLAEEANQLKSRFLATVSHELRTPLSLIVGTSEMMLREHEALKSALSPSLVKDAQTIQSSAEHLARLISDVLDLASSQAGELRLVAERLPLGEVLHRAALLAEPMAREKGLFWRTEIAPKLPLIRGDRTRLQQVVLNLVSNAIKFTEQGGITLWVEIGKEEALVAVSDTGIGIPISEQEVIFDEFRQSERAARRGYGGMGLGLAISRRLVELHGGRIGVISSGTDGAGSTFYFTLPILEWPEEVEAQPDSRLGVVLLLTDRSERATVMSEHLAYRGFEVETLVVHSGDDWLSQIIAAPPGAIVLDYEPATEVGWRAMQALKLNPATIDIPVLFYSLLEGRDSGAMLALDYLAKPISSSALTHALLRQGIDCEAEGGKTILVVDDEPGIVDLHTRILEAKIPDCRILRAGNGIEALAVMQQNRPDLVLLDLMMPGMDGFALLERMREAEPTRATPVIVLTAQVLTEEDVARLQRGVSAILGKGLFTTAEVLGQVERALTRSKHLGSDARRLAHLVMTYLHEHYAEPIGREELARHFAVNERHLTRCFHQEMGIPPIAYLNRYRVQRACALLEAGEASITEIALASGFSDSAYFARVFQRELGISPSAYRRGQRVPTV